MESFNLVQIGMNSIRARQVLLGWNRALNQSLNYLEGLSEWSFTDDELDVIETTYENIPRWKRRLDHLDIEMDRLMEGIGTLPHADFDLFAADFKATLSEIDTEMEALGQILIRHRH